MTNQPPYVPILKWRKAEKLTLDNLTASERTSIAPLVQLVPQIKVNNKTKKVTEVPKKKTLISAIQYIQNDIGDIRVYLDYRPLYDEVTDEIISITDSFPTLFESNIVPTLRHIDMKNQSYSERALEFIKTQGICLRVSEQELDNSFWENIDISLGRVGISREKVDLIIDYQVTKTGQKDLFITQITNNERTKGWRSFYFASGAFPEDLSQFGVGTNPLERTDWQLWNDIIKNVKGSRMPGYSDYTIQYPIYSKPINNPNTSFSVRYATADKWLIMRGQARNAKGSEEERQYYAHSLMLLKNPSFSGETCCEGDRYITKIAKGPAQNLGNSTIWLTVGITHHISLTLKQLAIGSDYKEIP